MRKSGALEDLRPTFDDIRSALNRIRMHVHRTLVLTNKSIDRMLGCELYFKCENFQKVGAFKARGAINAVFSLSEEKIRHGVATHSSGNHAAALALAARLRGTEAWIVMPRSAPSIKKTAVEGYGAHIIECEPTLRSREDTLAEVVERTGATFIHPYNDELVIAGQGTAALELHEEAGELDIVLTPVGGGGLLSGTAISIRSLSRNTRVIAGEPAGADDAYRSLRAKKILPSTEPKTIADGLLTSLGDKTFPIISALVEDIVTVGEESIIEAMRTVWERMKIIIEPSSAVPLAALFERKVDVEGKKVGIILSGGNVDLARLPWNRERRGENG